MKKNSLVIFVIFLLYSMSVFSNINVSAKEVISSFDNKITDGDESHIIEGVPYVAQNRYSCGFASFTMIIKYYGHNTCLEEVLFNSGIGYSLAYTRFFKIPGISLFAARVPTFGAYIAQNPFIIADLADLYDLHFNFRACIPPSKQLPEDERWDKYWLKVKNYIINDIPVIPSLDPLTLPYYREKFNITDNETHGGHAVVLVGFNETNGTVCYNDPGPGLWNDSINGTYVYTPIEIFKNAVRNTAGYNLIYIIENHSNSPPLSKEERFKTAHEKNIQRMKGYFGAYFGFQIPITFPYFGIKGLYNFKRDLQMGIFRRAFTVIKYSNFEGRDLYRLNQSFSFFSFEKHDMSQFLFENEDLSSVCKYDAILLQKESECWKNMSQLALQLNELGKNNGFLKMLILSKSITDKMKKELDEIISIEEKIIAGPSEN